MREILFRGLTLDGKWVYSMNISKGTIKSKRDCLFMEIAEDKWKGIKPETLGQFTGLKDKNGVKIFEGDVYHQGDRNIKYKVIFKNGQFVGNQINNKSLAGLNHFIKDIEIIRNIYEKAGKSKRLKPLV